jgi:serine/threonine-protein kinase
MPTAELTLVGSGEIAGTPQYMSPEQAAGASREITPATDVYALGVILFELLTGRRPFQATSSDLLRLIREEPPPPLRDIVPGIDPRLEEICSKAMAKRPSDRYTTAGELRLDVERYLGKPGSEDQTIVIARPPAGRFPRSRWIALGAVAVALLLALVPLSRMWPEKQTTVNVSLTTRPAGARVVFWQLDDDMNEPDPSLKAGEGVSPVNLQLKPGRYLVVAVLEDGRFHEVYREVPDHPQALPQIYAYSSWRVEDGVVRLATINIPELGIEKGMIKVEGAADFLQGFPLPDLDDPRDERPFMPGAFPIHVRLSDFWISPHEATWTDYLTANQNRPPVWWNPQVPFPPGSEPILLSWSEAVDFAEMTGRRLLSEAEFECVATNLGSTLYPWGDDATLAEPWRLASVTETPRDVTSRPAGVFNLFSNAGEWTSTRNYIPPVNLPGGVLPDLPTDYAQSGYVVKGHVVPVDSSQDLRDPEMVAAAIRNSAPINWQSYGARFRKGSASSSYHGFHFARSAAPRDNPDAIARYWPYDAKASQPKN